MSNWENYYQKTSEKPPRPLLVESLSFLSQKNNALDIGAGALNDTRYLLKENFKEVIAIDSAPASLELSHKIKDSRFTYHLLKVENYAFPSRHFNLVNAQLSLPFLLKKDFLKVWEAIKQTLRPEAILCGQLFGNNDEWNTPKSQMTFLTREEVLELLKDYEVIKFQEIERNDSATENLSKHSHIFNLILKKL